MKILYTVFLVFVFFIYGCSSGDGTPNENVCGAGTFSSIPGQPDECIVPPIDGDFTFTSGLVWKVDSPITIGGTADATLTIEAGSIIEMEPATYIHVLPGSDIKAVGTASLPIQIKFIGPSAPSSRGGGSWGGIYIEDTAANDVQNRMEYVVISDAGEDVFLDLGSGPTTYNNGLMLIGDHSDTTLRFVNIHDSGGDGLVLEGIDSTDQNTARVDWLLVTGSERDGISYNHFSGLIKNAMVIHREVVSSIDGRAGLFAKGVTSNPLITNLTLIGRDVDGDLASATSDEYGIIFGESVTNIRLSNVFIYNFEDGCYQVTGASGNEADLSSIGVAVPANITSGSFIDGVHCVNTADEDTPVEESDFATLDNAAGGFTDSGISNGDGIRYWDDRTAVFDTGASNTTEKWRLVSIDSRPNDQVGTLQDPLNRFNVGDTNDSGSTSEADRSVEFYLGATGDSFFGPVNIGSTGEDFATYDLTQIGALTTSNVEAFTGWTALDNVLGGAEVTGFEP